MNIAVSRCLLGVPCRYDGRAKRCEEVCALADCIRTRGGVVVDVCPEVEAGLPTPRVPAELAHGRVVQADGTDVTDAFALGARLSYERMNASGVVPLAVLKAKSPSCGVGVVYDGTHSGALTKGDGVFAALLKKEGVSMAIENEVLACRPSVERPIAIVLGSGLGHLAGLVKPVRRIAYRDIQGFPSSARPVAGHNFEATIGTIDGVPVVVYPGRVHLYQGYSALEVTALVRHAQHLGCRVMMFACATGAIDEVATVGLGLITDHINLTGVNPLVGWNGQEPELALVDSGFVGMTDVYTDYLQGIARGVAADQGIELSEGVLAGVLGPSFETPAEVRMLRTIGASYVGCSTVCEAIMAHALGMRVLGLTLSANYAGDAGVSHESVLMAARDHADEFERLVRGILTLL